MGKDDNDIKLAREFRQTRELFNSVEKERKMINRLVISAVGLVVIVGCIFGLMYMAGAF